MIQTLSYNFLFYWYNYKDWLFSWYFWFKGIAYIIYIQACKFGEKFYSGVLL